MDSPRGNHQGLRVELAANWCEPQILYEKLPQRCMHQHFTPAASHSRFSSAIIASEPVIAKQLASFFS